MKRILISTLALAPAMLLAALLVPATAGAAGPISTAASCSSTGPGAVSCDLWAKPGTLALPGTSVTAWGYSTTAGGAPTFPGPSIVVNAGDTLTLNLTNSLPQPTSLVVQGLSDTPDLTSVAAGGTHTYTIHANAPGTYLYEAGILPGSEYQVPMGLYGTLVVRPAGLPGQAYAGVDTAFADEALVVVSEVDPALTGTVVTPNPAPETFDLRQFAPKFFLVNGVAYTTAGATSIPVTSGNTLLLRYANAGILHHSMGILGLHQRVLAADGSQLPAQRTMVAETIAPGQTADVLISLPATTAASTLYPVYDAALVLNNSSASGIGGMLALLDSAGTTGGTDTIGPATSAVTVDASTGALSASVTDAASGGSSVTAAEYFIDTAGAAGTGTAMTGTFPSDPAAVTATIPAPTLAGLASGSHTIYVRGQDGAAIPNWGPLSSTSFLIDRTGPTVSGLALSPNPSSGSVAVTLTGTASDVATGNGNVVAAEYFIGVPGPDGTGTVVARNLTATVVSLNATIPAPVSSGTVSVHAKDLAGNWGPFATINLVVDASGPTTSGISAAPPANNGSYGQSTSNPSVRVSATFSDVASGGQAIAAGEGFIDPVGTPAPGTGFPFSPTDGTFNAATEAGYADIPLSTINTLTSGNHTISVRGRDAGGSWGTLATLTYLIDRTAPTFTGISLAPNPTLGSPITLTVNGAADPLAGGLASGVAGGEYWIDGAAPAPGSGIAFTGSSASIPTTSIPTGNHTIGARVRDAAGNWSTTTASATVYVVPDTIFTNGFETGGAPWGWSSRSTTSTTRLDVTTSPALVGARSLQAQGNNTNYVQFNFGTTANPAWPTYDARFVFRPNANASTGKDILAAATSNTFGTTLFHVRYRLNGTTPQVQIQVGATANGTWTNLLGGTSNNTIEVVWQSGGSLVLYVNGVSSQTLAATAGSVGAVRLGSVTNVGANTLMYFDAFASKRTVSPLFGP